jgi:hypothetical protein
MKYYCFVSHPESYRKNHPPAALMEAMGKYVEQGMKSGVLVDAGGFAPSAEGARIKLEKGRIAVHDGPFAESKEVIGGWAIIDVPDKAAAIRVGEEFMELHRKHWPEFEGTSEIRRMFGPTEGP